MTDTLNPSQPLRRPESIIKNHNVSLSTKAIARAAIYFKSIGYTYTEPPTLEEIHEYIDNHPRLRAMYRIQPPPPGPLPDFYTPFHHPADIVAEALGIEEQQVYRILADYYLRKGEYHYWDHNTVRETLGLRGSFQFYHPDLPSKGL